MSRYCRDGNDHEVDQKLATDFFAELLTELPTMATILVAMPGKAEALVSESKIMSS